MTVEIIHTALAAAAAALENATWTALQGSPNGGTMPAGASFYQGDAAPWRFVVTAFDIEDQGFPKGSLGYDGMARNEAEGLVIRLTRPLAERAYKLAKAN